MRDLVAAGEANAWLAAASAYGSSDVKAVRDVKVHLQTGS